MKSNVMSTILKITIYWQESEHQRVFDVQIDQ